MTNPLRDTTNRWILLATLLATLPACAHQGTKPTNSAANRPTRDDSAADTALKAQPKPLTEEERAFSASAEERIRAVQPVVGEAAQEHELDPALINAVIWVESRFQPKAKSKAGARGLMQLMPATAASLAKQMGEQRPRVYDPQFNVHAGSFYLAKLIAKFDDETLAVAAYHAGPGNVGKWLATGQEFPEYSQKYVDAVFTARQRFDSNRQAAPVQRSQAFAAPVEPMVDEPKQAEPEPTPAVVREPEPTPEIPFEEPVFREASELDPPASAPTDELPKAPPPSPRKRQEVGIGVLPDV